MKDTKKSTIFVVTIAVILLWCIPTPIIEDYGKSNTQEQKLYSRNSAETILKQSIWKFIQQSQSDTFDLNVEIFGYRIIATDVNPITYDENSQLSFFKNSKGFINLELSLEFGDYEFYNISVRGHLVIDFDGNYFISYNLDDPEKGFFMDIFFFSNSIQFDLAFDGGDWQLNYEGAYNQGYIEIPALFPNIFEPDQVVEDISKYQLLQNQKEKVFIYNQKYLNEIITLGFSYTKYGIAHEFFDFSLTYPEDLPDDYWEPYTSINIGIYRYLPSEAQVKSDLQYYNRDYFRGLNGYMRDILAYNMISHGGPFWEKTSTIRIYPNEIEQLWYHYYNPSTGEEIDVYPWNTILIVDACYSYYKPPSTNPTMAKAFVDYGAKAFVGSTILVPADSDDFMLAFWEELCQNNENVRQATITLCDTYGQGWNLGDEWRIYGNQYGQLP